MAPVIRVSEDVFRRLQSHGQPLVDTPSTVIERILDRIDAVGEASPATTLPTSSSRTGTSAPTDLAPDRPVKLFLAPATGENARATLVRGVDDFHHFDHETGPEFELSPAALKQHNEITERQAKILYAGTPIKNFDKKTA